MCPNCKGSKFVNIQLKGNDIFFYVSKLAVEGCRHISIFIRACTDCGTLYVNKYQIEDEG